MDKLSCSVTTVVSSRILLAEHFYVGRGGVGRGGGRENIYIMLRVSFDSTNKLDRWIDLGIVSSSHQKLVNHVDCQSKFEDQS